MAPKRRDGRIDKKRVGRRRKEIAAAEDAFLSEEVLEKRNHRRANNKLAAAKYRQKKVIKINELEAEVKLQKAKLEEKDAKLEEQSAELREKDLLIAKLVRVMKGHNIPTEGLLLASESNIIMEAMKTAEIMECENCFDETDGRRQSSLKAPLAQQVHMERQKDSTSSEKELEGQFHRMTTETDEDSNLSTRKAGYADRPTYIKGFVLSQANNGSNMQGAGSKGNTPISSLISSSMEIANGSPIRSPLGQRNPPPSFNPWGSTGVTAIPILENDTFIEPKELLVSDSNLSTQNAGYADRPTHIEGFVPPQTTSSSTVQEAGSSWTTPISWMVSSAVRLVNGLLSPGSSRTAPILDSSGPSGLTPTDCFPPSSTSPLSPVNH